MVVAQAPCAPGSHRAAVTPEAAELPTVPAARLGGIADRGDDGGGRGLADTYQLHELLRGVAVTRHGADVHVVQLDALVQLDHLAEQAGMRLMQPAAPRRRR